MKEPGDKIIDAFLDEMLNDVRPEKSAPEILRFVESKLANSTDSVASTDGDLNIESVKANELETITESDNVAHALSPVTKNTSAPVSKNLAAVNERKPASSQTSFAWKALTTLAALLVTAISIGVLLYQLNLENSNDPIAKDPPNKSENKELRQVPSPGIVQTPPDERIQTPTTPQAPRLETDIAPPESPQIALHQNDEIPTDQHRLVLPPEFQRGELTLVAVSPEQMSGTINQHLQAAWDDKGITATRPLDLTNWVNRLSSRMIGRAPNAIERQQLNGLLVQGKSPELVKLDLIRFFLETPELRSEFNQHWGRTLAWQMLGISPTMEAGDADMVRTRIF